MDMKNLYKPFLISIKMKQPNAKKQLSDIVCTSSNAVSKDRTDAPWKQFEREQRTENPCVPYAIDLSDENAVH